MSRIAATSYRSSLAIALLSVAGCGEEGDGPDLVFPDPVVEARVRNLLVQRLTGDPCEAVWAVAAAEVSGAVRVESQTGVGYPVRPADLLPDGDGDFVHVAARDPEGRVVARACGRVDAPLSFHALPPCRERPNPLDLVLVFDASEDMAFASAAMGGVVASYRRNFIEGGEFPTSSEHTVYVHGEGGVIELVERETVASVGADALEAREQRFAGLPTPFSAIVEASRVLRDRASCARQPVMLVISAGPSADQAVLPAEAAFGLYASQADRADDLFTFGIGIGQDAVAELAIVIPDELGEIRGASTASTLQGALREANAQLRTR